MAGASSSFNPKSFEWLVEVPIHWEQRRHFRARSLRGRSLLQGVFLPSDAKKEVIVSSLECCQLNAEVLSTVLRLMGDNACIFVPPMPLLSAVTLEFHSHSGFPCADSLASTAYSDSKGLKRMLSLLRRKWRREEYPREPIDAKSKTFILIRTSGVGTGAS